MSSKFIFASVVAATIIFSGCASKDVKTSNDNINTQSKTGANSSTTDTTPNSNSASSQVASKLQSILFDFDKFNIRADMQSAVDNDVKVVSSTDMAKEKIKLEGNADERGTDEYNYALALKRANAVKSGFESKGIAGSRISTVSLGEGNPICKEHTEECWLKNRRVAVKIDK